VASSILEVDLAAAGCRQLRISARCSVEPTELLAHAGGKVPVRLRCEYVAGDVRHALTLRISSLGPKESDLGLSLVYSQPTENPIQSESSVSEVERIVQSLAQSTQQLRFDCGARFVQNREAYTSLIPLPLRSDEWKDLPFDDIVGFRFRKRDGDRTVYNVIVELISNEYHESLSYNWESHLSLELPSAVLNAGKDIVGRFVFRTSAKP